MTGNQAQHLVDAMSRAFPEALVEDYESLLPQMKNDPKDRHVAAAAVRAGATVIVTMDLKDFRELPEDIEARSPNVFLCELMAAEPAAMVALVKAQAATLKRPPRTFGDILRGLGTMVPAFVAALRAESI